VVEEKMDGANAGVSFTPEGELLLQSRGHYLSGGPRERHFARFKQWAGAHRAALWSLLGARYVLYGEWLVAKHTCFYDQLPHYFMEFDVLDRERDMFLSTAARRRLLAGSPVVSVAVLREGSVDRVAELTELLGRSLFKSSRWREALISACARAGVAAATGVEQTDREDAMEGLYLKVEDDERVLQRLKYVRASFTSTILEAGDHWLTRPIIENQLASGVDLWTA
jgi:hypothetical protein